MKCFLAVLIFFSSILAQATTTDPSQPLYQVEIFCALDGHPAEEIKKYISSEPIWANFDYGFNSFTMPTNKYLHFQSLCFKQGLEDHGTFPSVINLMAKQTGYWSYLYPLFTSDQSAMAKGKLLEIFQEIKSKNLVPVEGYRFVTDLFLDADETNLKEQLSKIQAIQNENTIKNYLSEQIQVDFKRFDFAVFDSQKKLLAGYKNGMIYDSNKMSYIISKNHNSSSSIAQEFYDFILTKIKTFGSLNRKEKKTKLALIFHTRMQGYESQALNHLTINYVTLNTFKYNEDKLAFSISGSRLFHQVHLTKNDQILIKTKIYYFLQIIDPAKSLVLVPKVILGEREMLVDFDQLETGFVEHYHLKELELPY